MIIGITLEVLSAVTTFVEGDVGFDGHSITLDVGNTDWVNGDKVIVEFEAAHPVGGIVLSPDSVSLLLLEAESSAVWWLPVVIIAGAGMVLLQIKKKI